MYSEEQVLQRVSNTKKKQIVIIIMIVCGVLILALAVGLFFYLKNLPLIKVPTVDISTMEWTTENVILKVTDDKSKISEYCFNEECQSNPDYVVQENTDLSIRVIDKNGKSSKRTIVSIQNIDRNPPEMIFENTTTVQMGSNFSVRTGVQVSDDISGLSDNYAVVPSSIDTSVEGEYTLTYSAFDKAGNFVEKTRSIIVKDIKGRTYYRYRTGQLEITQCEPYLCKCVSSQAALETGSCPAGYQLNDDGQCCQTCYNTCRNMIWGEWSEWQQRKVVANSTTEVETMIKED